MKSHTFDHVLCLPSLWYSQILSLRKIQLVRSPFGWLSLHWHGCLSAKPEACRLFWVSGCAGGIFVIPPEKVQLLYISDFYSVSGLFLSVKYTELLKLVIYHSMASPGWYLCSISYFLTVDY